VVALARGLAFRLALGLGLAALANPDSPGDGWSGADADARVPLSVQGDLYAREKLDLEAVVDFNALLGMRRVLAADSLSLLDAGTDHSVPLEAAQDAEIRHASGNPILRLRWTCRALAPFERRTWRLYFRTVEPGDESAWTPLAETWLPTSTEVLLDTGFEAADPDRPTRPEFMNPGGRDKPGETTERVWTDEEAHGGKRSLKIARTIEGEPPRNTNRPFWWTWPPPVSVRPGQSVRLSAWLKATRLESGALALLNLEFRDADRKRLPDGRLLLRGKRVIHDWLRVSSSTTAPPGAAWAVFWFMLAGQGQVYCDDVTVRTIPGGELPRPPVTAGALETRAAFAAAQDERPEGKVLPCGVAQQPPALDGALDDSCWRSAGRIRDFEVHTQMPGASVTTTVLACADRDALYFGFECTEPSTAELKANATKRDGRLWEDDSVELFLDTNGDLHTYYQLIVNSRGVIFDQDKGAPGLAGAKWDGPVTAAARVLPDRWTAEVKLEFTGLRLAETEGRLWGANFARSSFRGGRSLYVWSPVKRNFGEPQHFGRIVLPFDPSANVVTGRPPARDGVFWGAGTLAFEVDNRRDRPVSVRLSATEQTDEGDRPLGVSTAVVDSRAVADLRLPATLPEPGEVRVRYDLVEAETGKLLYRTSVGHLVPEPLLVEPAALVSYLGEDRLRGAWTLGLADEALPDVRLALTVLPAGGTAPAVASEIAPKAATGAYALDVSRLPAGRHELRVRLLRNAETLDQFACRFARIIGPFSPAP